MAALRVRSERFILGYLTGSQRRPGDFNYPRPGLVISGAISLAVDEVNEKLLGPLGHSLDFIVAETYGQEEVSIKQRRPTNRGVVTRRRGREQAFGAAPGPAFDGRRREHNNAVQPARCTPEIIQRELLPRIAMTQ
ncbi:hypothetical protein EVAR_7110_1 [Eumeta japonica]|uniref:Uncharacterized protein n=1 Tax=Eumeta variegata TaxID=151549 RepID=A0A4C1U737_EUMVA|nr:hypothetical protein EVAR_7110_1 [Eumeta japonica]